MEAKECIERLKKEYANTNGCREAYHELLQCVTKDDIIEVYKRNYQWCLENDFPDIDLIRREFSGYEKENIFVGRHFNGETVKAQTVIFHDCTGVVNVEMDYEEKIIPMLYFANGCRMNVVCRQENVFPIRVPLYIFGENHIIATDTEDVEYRKYFYDNE